MFYSNNLNNQNLGSFLLLPEICDILQNIKIPSSDLCKLKTLSSSYYKTFIPMHMKRLKKASVHFTLYEDQLNAKGQAQVWVQKKKSGNRLYIGSIEKWNEVYKEYANYFHSISIIIKCRDSEWAWANHVVFVQLDPIISSLRPHIREISISKNTASPFSEYLVQNIGKLSQQFKNLEKVNLLNNVVAHIRLSHLYQFVSSLDSNIQFHLSVWSDELHPALLAQSNIFFKIFYIQRPWEEQISRFENLLEKYKKYKPHRVGFYVDMCSISTVAEMLRVTELCVENQKCIQGMTLNFYPAPQILARFEDQTIVEKCFLRLSGIITTLKLKQVTNVKLDLLRGIPIWPKLTALYIDGYEHRLEILKRCPKLKNVGLNGVNWYSCIFHNHQTIGESLQEYFGNLSKLKFINCGGLGQWNAKNIKAILKKIVSPDTEFGGFSHYIAL